jgi:hypothetical protein
MNLNIKDIFYKLFWTGVSAVLGAALVYVTSLDPPLTWAPIFTLAINAALAWVRQMTGETPPDLPPPSL